MDRRVVALLGHLTSRRWPTILAHLEPMRSMRPWPNDPAPSAASDLAIHRVIASGGRGATVELRTAP